MTDRPLEGRLVLLGVTGSIAAYKAAELVRLLIAAGADVQVLMTHTASKFIGPLTLETLSRRVVMLDPLELLPDRRIGHIVAADTADAISSPPRRRAGWRRWPPAWRTTWSPPPASPDGAGRRRAGDGRRDVRAPRDARERRAAAGLRLRDRRARGRSAGLGRGRPGTAGGARRPSSTRSSRRSATARSESRTRARRPPARPPPPQDLAGGDVLVTAGGTAEPIDPVRFIGNRSTGRMGVAIAEAALARGARVTLVAGRHRRAAPRCGARSSARDDRGEHARGRLGGAADDRGAGDGRRRRRLPAAHRGALEARRATAR